MHLHYFLHSTRQPVSPPLTLSLRWTLDSPHLFPPRGESPHIDEGHTSDSAAVVKPATMKYRRAGTMYATREATQGTEYQARSQYRGRARGERWPPLDWRLQPLPAHSSIASTRLLIISPQCFAPSSATRLLRSTAASGLINTGGLAHRKYLARA